MHLFRLYYFLGDTETNSYQPLHMNFIYSPKVGYNVSVLWDPSETVVAMLTHKPKFLHCLALQRVADAVRPVARPRLRGVLVHRLPELLLAARPPPLRPRALAAPRPRPHRRPRRRLRRRLRHRRPPRQ